MLSIIKTTMKLLLRNKGFWFFLLITPILSTVILNVQQTNLGAYEFLGENEIIELEKTDNMVAYYGGRGKYIVKVYDASGSELSEYMLNKLTESGLFMVCRVKCPGMTKSEVDAQMEHNGYHDRMGAALYINKDFDAEAISGKYENGMIVYILSDDERTELLENELKMITGQIKTAAEYAGSEDIISFLELASEQLPQKNVEIISGSNSRNLTNDQLDKKAILGYAFAFMTLGFVFCGIFIAHTVINEQKDMVVTRIRLTDLTDVQYFTAKFICGGIVSLMLTAILGICTIFVDAENMGFSRPKLIMMLFLMGLIFCSISLLFGILFGNVMSANIAAFTIWCMSSMLAGLYFPIDSTTKAVKLISYLMPQKWFVDASEMLMIGDNRAYFVILCVTAAYMIITLSLGSVGIKYRNYEA